MSTPEIEREAWQAKMRDKAVWSSQCSNIKVLTLGQAERLIQEILTTYSNARELQGVEKVKSKKKRILVVSDSGEVVPLDVILLRDLQSLEVKQELK